MTRFLSMFAFIALLAGPVLAQEAEKPAAAQPSPGIPAIVEVEVLLAEWTVADNEKSDLSGDAQDVAQRIAALEERGKLTVSQRMRITTVSDNESMVQVGEQRPRVVGVSAGGWGGRGGAAGAAGAGGGAGLVSSINYHNVGTLLRVKPSVRAENTILMEVTLERTDVATHPNSPVLAEPPMGEKIRAESTTTIQLQSTLRLVPDKTVVLAGHAANNERQIVLVTAKITK